LSDIEAERTVLRVRLTKFYKSRLVPLSPTVTAELKQYLEQRERNKLPMGAGDVPDVEWMPFIGGLFRYESIDCVASTVRERSGG
jgi:integrase